MMRKSCDKILGCGHPCCGFVNEAQCLPCLDPSCVEKDKKKTLEVTCDDYCKICYTSGLGEAPCV